MADHGRCLNFTIIEAIQIFAAKNYLISGCDELHVDCCE